MANNDTASTGVADPDIETAEYSASGSSVHNSADPAIGAGLGLVGGAIVGGVAGGPLGAVIGAVVGAVASDAAVVGVEHMDRAYTNTDAAPVAFDNSGASTADYDASTGVTRGDRTVGDVSVTDHTIFGSGSGEMVDDSVPIGRTSNSDTRNPVLEDGTNGPTYP